jgi:hypothetical protein
MGKSVVRKLWIIIYLAGFGLLTLVSQAETYQLINGEALVGELLPASANDQGVQVKVGEGKYEKVPWGNFSQEDLRKFRENAKLAPFVEPFVEITPEERVKKTEVPIKQPTRLARPPSRSFFGAMFSNTLGVVIMLVLYGAIIYAGYEVAIFRAQSIPLVVGLSAIPFLGFLAPIIFISLPTKMPASAAYEEPVAPAEAVIPGVAPAGAAPDSVNPMQGEVSAEPAGGLHIAHAEPTPAKPALPAPTVFQRGQFTFNRRFFETKFVGFFGAVRRDADKDMVLIVKSARGEYRADRITRIAANDVHLQVSHGEASQEVMVPFTEIKELILKHKDAP